MAYIAFRLFGWNACFVGRTEFISPRAFESHRFPVVAQVIFSAIVRIRQHCYIRCIVWRTFDGVIGWARWRL